MLQWDSNVDSILRRIQRTNYPRMAFIATEFIADAALQKAPVRTGRLRGSIGAQPVHAYRTRRRGRGQNVSLQVVVGAPYALYVNSRSNPRKASRRFLTRSILAVRRKQRMLRKMGRTLFDGVPSDG